MLVGVERQLAHAVSLLQSGSRVDVVGGRGSGRTSILIELQSQLVAMEYAVVLVRGVASLQSVPLASLGLAGIALSREQRAAASVASAVAELGSIASKRDLAIIIDDWDDLDEITWGVIEAARRQHRIPLALGRLRGRRARHTPTGLGDSTLERAFEIGLNPMGFDELERVVENHLGGPIEESTMSRLFAKSGGIVGLALAVVDAALYDDRLVTRSGIWTVLGELWSPMLRGVVEAHLESLSTPERDHLEILSLAGITALESAADLVGWDSIERFEELDLVQLYRSGERTLATVFPPLIVEFFRHEPLRAHRIRLSEELGSRLGHPLNEWAIEQRVAEPDSGEHANAILIRLLQEQQRNKLLAAQSEWTRTRTLAAGVRFVRELIDSNATPAIIDAALAQCVGLDGEDEELARIAILESRWVALAHGDLERALERLRVTRTKVGRWSRLIDAEIVFAQLRSGQVPDDVDDITAPEPGTPAAATGALWEVRAYANLSLGKLAAARTAIEHARETPGFAIADHFRALEAFIVMADGDFVPAGDLAISLLEQARSSLEINTLRVSLYAAGLCFATQGRFERATEFIELNAALGVPPVTLQAESDALMNIAHAIPFRIGGAVPSLPETEATASHSTRDGLLPGMSGTWANAHDMLARGEYSAATTLLTTAADELWERGGRLAAAVLILTALEVAPERGLWERYAPLLDEIEGRFIGAHRDYVEGLVDHDEHKLLDAARELAKQGRVSLATIAFRAAERWARRSKNEAVEALARDARRELKAQLENDHFDDRRFPSGGAELSPRELEIATLVAEGLTNREIADEIVVSVRTVESHVHRVLKKFNVDSRRDLVEPLAEYREGTRFEQ